MKYKIFSTLILFASTSFAYYSQIGQDRYLNEHFFKNKRNGVFIDIGAYDGITYSNSYFFEKELGWSGICIEPLKKPFKKLKALRKCICINGCIADVAGMIDFIKVTSPHINTLMLSGMLSTYEPQHLQRMQQEIVEMGGSFKIIKRSAYRFNDLMQQHNITAIDYLSIDVEGGELSILKSIDFDTYYIYAISVENNYRDPAIGELLSSQGFKFVTTLEWDDIYINSR